MRTKDVLVIAFLAWLLMRKSNSSVNFVITEPGFEGTEVGEVKYQ
jgi:hypothetical protein